MAGKRDEQMKEITERLEQGVKELFTSEMYTEYLRTMSQFHNYSFNNTLLIAMQKPDATLVAGFQAWQKKFERHVKRGEKGIQIIAPAPIKEKQEREKIDPVTQELVLRSDGQPETEEVEIVIPRFRVTTVFDVSQTEGKPLPEIDTPELMGSIENFGRFMESIEQVSTAPIRFAKMDSDTKGYYHQIDKEIVIQEGMSESQTMKTAVHEVTHAMLHDRELMKESGEWKSQMTREVEAESVAYTVCQYFGLDTSDYSFPYIAGWSSHMDMKELRASMDTIRKTAGEFIDVMTETMQELMRDNNLDRTNEELLLDGTGNQYGIYQIDRDGKGREYSFMNMDFVKDRGLVVDRADYKLVYADELTERDTLDSIYEKFNMNHPADFSGHSLSVSDVVVIRHGEEMKAYYVDSVGFTEIPEFIQENEVEPEVRKALERAEIPVYKYAGTYASEHMEAHWYRMSMRANVDCKGAIEAAIAENFDGMHLKHDVVNPVITAFGAERVAYVLANTVQRKEWDGRFSRDNKEWAQTIPVVEDKDGFDGDRRNEFVVDSHPAVLDGFIGLARKEFEALIMQKEEEQSREGEVERNVAQELGNHDTEIAYQAGDKYFAIQTVDDGYDYTFYDQDYKEIDGGVYDNPDISIQEAIKDILSDEGISVSDCEEVSYEELQEWVEAVQQITGTMPLISDRTEPEAALNNLSPAEIEETVLCYAQSKIDEIGLTEDVKILGARVYGSRSSEGAYSENSDMDVVVSYSGEMREDAFFNMLHEDGLQLAGLPVDINPISTETTGTLQEYLEKANEYLDKKESQVSADAILGDEPTAETVEAKISFYAAECMEFSVSGEFHENLTLQEAMEVYQSIPVERMNAIKGIGFCLEDGSMYDGKFDLMSGGEVLKDIINDIPHYRESPLVQKAIKDMEELLSEPEKEAEKVSKAEKDVSPRSDKKQSVLKALRERKTKLMSQEQGDSKPKAQTVKKGEQEL